MLLIDSLLKHGEFKWGFYNKIRNFEKVSKKCQFFIFLFLFQMLATERHFLEDTESDLYLKKISVIGESDPAIYFDWNDNGKNLNKLLVPSHCTPCCRNQPKYHSSSSILCVHESRRNDCGFSQKWLFDRNETSSWWALWKRAPRPKHSSSILWHHCSSLWNAINPMASKSLWCYSSRHSLHSLWNQGPFAFQCLAFGFASSTWNATDFSINYCYWKDLAKHARANWHCARNNESSSSMFISAKF